MYNHSETEPKIYEMWEKGGYFTPKTDPAKKPFTILLPPPNASGRMHTGNVLMIAIEDILIRWHRMMGDPTLWVPGTDHAGTETQITFERELKKQGKSRFDFDRNSLYEEIWKFVENNVGLVSDQIRRMGASVDWSRYKFTLDDAAVETVRDTFKKMHDDGLVYRDDYIVNYCPVCGTTYADIEVSYKERNDPLYYMKYGPFEIATVRPESKFRDTALAANPKDKRYSKWLGKTVEVRGLLGPFKMTVIADPDVDPKFGTGIMKVTPAHDPHDFELGKKHNLPVTPIIDLNGRMDFSWFLAKKDVEPKYLERAKKYHGSKVLEARKMMVEDLKEDGLLVKVDENYTHSVPVCKAGHDIEPTVLPNWFIKVGPLKEPAHEVVKNGGVKILPKWREVTYHRWMENMHDWAISRQNVWGIRIPVWYNVDDNPQITASFLDRKLKVVAGRLGDLLKKYDLSEISSGLQRLMVDKSAKYVISNSSPGERFLRETDTFDTWFSSG
ncbi:class I tRNA ligase family protein, partial [candidate division WWE3 bacterium]|nr:class I tRNA ligase family protein [candidate division WWE3 bacterium]